MTGTKKEDEMPDGLFRRDYGGRYFVNEIAREYRYTVPDFLRDAASAVVFAALIVVPLLGVAALLVNRLGLSLEEGSMAYWAISLAIVVLALWFSLGSPRTSGRRSSK